jgi:choice-of-anchor A domain-containing protein
MKCITILSSVFLLATPVFAQDCRVLTPADYLVFSEQDIQFNDSDFQGLTGAGRDAQFSGFLIRQSDPTVCQALIVGRNGGMFSGSIEGSVEAGSSFRQRDASVDGRVRQGLALGDVNALADAAEFFREQSAQLSSLRATKGPETIAEGLLLSDSHAISVFSLSAADFTSHSVVTIDGSPNQIVIVNLHGSSVSISGMDIELEGGIKPESVIFNFPETTDLTITASGSQEYGIPGTILAPAASTHFSNDRITGGLYVGNLEGDGQVNYAKTRWPQSPCVN